MNIAILDNETHCAEDLKKLCATWAENNTILLRIDSYRSPKVFLAMDTNALDLVFLDIQLEHEQNGVDVAHHLRQGEFRGELVFLTAFSQYVFEGYDVSALNYLLKPPSYEQVEKCLDHLAAKYYGNKYTFRHKKSVFQIPFSDILYFSSANHRTHIVTKTEVYTQPESIKSILSHLPKQFLPCHRTAIINMDEVQMLNGRDLHLSNGDIVPVSQKHIEDIREAFLTLMNKMR